MAAPCHCAWWRRSLLLQENQDLRSVLNRPTPPPPPPPAADEDAVDTAPGVAQLAATNKASAPRPLPAAGDLRALVSTPDGDLRALVGSPKAAAGDGLVTPAAVAALARPILTDDGALATADNEHGEGAPMADGPRLPDLSVQLATAAPSRPVLPDLVVEAAAVPSLAQRIKSCMATRPRR